MGLEKLTVSLFKIGRTDENIKKAYMFTLIYVYIYKQNISKCPDISLPLNPWTGGQHPTEEQLSKEKIILEKE